MLTVVTGPPCAGKSTYIAERAQHGDIIIDLDAIARALTAPTEQTHDYPRHVRVVAVAARAAAVERALRFARTDKRVWIIHCDPPHAEVQTYRYHGAQFVTLDPGIDVCLERAAQCRPDPRVIDVIHDWYT